MAASARGQERRVREQGRASLQCVCVCVQFCPPILHKVPSNILLQDRSLFVTCPWPFPHCSNPVLGAGRRHSEKPLGCMWLWLCKPAAACLAYQNMPSSLLRLMSLLIWQTEHMRHHVVTQKSEQMDPC